MKLIAICLCASAVLSAQVPRVGDVEYYGLRKVSPERVQRALNVKKGDPLPPSKGDLEDRLEEVGDVVQARVEAVCCEAGNAVLFVGIEERGAPHFAFRSEPAGNAVLPAELIETYQKFVAAVEGAARRSAAAEDLTRGHALMADPDARALQEQFVAFADKYMAVLRDVLRNGSEPEQRAIAAAVIGYAPDKKAVLDDLQTAMQDPDEAVRANAMRSLTAIAVLGARQPDLEIHIPPTWFVEMLNSIVLSDRTRAAAALVNMTEKNGTVILEQIRERALPAVLEMARWHTLTYALPPFILAGRLAGLSDKEIQEVWTRGDREPVLKRAIRTPKP